MTINEARFDPRLKPSPEDDEIAITPPVLLGRVATVVCHIVRESRFSGLHLIRTNAPAGELTLYQRAFGLSGSL